MTVSAAINTFAKRVPSFWDRTAAAHRPLEQITAEHVVIGIPGDEIDIRGGQVWVNGEPRDESFPVTRENGGVYPLTVDDDKLFVLGDNRGRSNDSRTWGQLPARNVVGRVWFGYWPPEQMKLFSSIGSAITQINLNVPVGLLR